MIAGVFNPPRLAKSRLLSPLGRASPGLAHVSLSIIRSQPGKGTMKAVHISSPGEVELADLSIPEPAPGEALLRVRYAGVCGSDLQTCPATSEFATYPHIPGTSSLQGDLRGGHGEAPGSEAGNAGDRESLFQLRGLQSVPTGPGRLRRESNETMGVHRDGAFREYLTLPARAGCIQASRSPRSSWP